MIFLLASAAFAGGYVDDQAAADAANQLLCALLAYALISGLVGMAWGDRNGRGGAGLILGVAFGPWGWIMAGQLAPSAEVALKRRMEAIQLDATARARAAEASPDDVVLPQAE